VTAEDALVQVDVGALQAALKVQATFPDVDLEPIGSGFYSFVFSAGQWIVRVARTAEAAERHVLESTVLPKLAPRLPVAIPQPRLVLPAGSAAPFGAYAYRALPGRMMNESDAAGAQGTAIAEDLAAALLALHSVAEGQLHAEIPDAERHHLLGLYMPTHRELRQRLTDDEYTRVRSWWKELLDSDIPEFPRRTLVHSDPWWENLTVDDGRLSGILDWEFLSWSDPANDIGVTLQMGEEFFRSVLATYKAGAATFDPTLERRARKLFASRVFYGVKFAIDRDDGAEWADSLAKLRAGPILNPER
jgi:aminoglycoside phosphotransferase (APT) family kinase protein